ncbi:unknown [Crocosphaera subtropica ATCC 51142]|uniref:Uncharacterized protein n=1 Tax=Crocosphaera subtropica (strain ATCC 51142 / BH68) TaxID=43989 RepID=B1WTD7_CROS5|nr:unknown [Crocosphaera subtropica ATCC 51142]
MINRSKLTKNGELLCQKKEKAIENLKSLNKKLKGIKSLKKIPNDMMQ